MKRTKEWPKPTKVVVLTESIKFKSLGVSGKLTIIPKGAYIVSGDISDLNMYDIGDK